MSSSIAHVVRLARIDVRRMVRKHTDWNRGLSALASVVVYVLLVGAVTIGGAYLAMRGSDALVAGTIGFDEDSTIRAVRGIVGVFWIVGLTITAVRAVGARGTLTNAEGVLSIVPTGQALAGIVVAEYAYVLLWILGPAIGVGIGLALGTGTVWPALGIPLAAALLGATVVAVGYPLGLAIRHVVTRFPFVARHKSLALAIVFFVYFLAFTTGTVDRIVVALFDPMMQSPVGWFADLGLLNVDGLAADPLRAGAAVVVTGAVVILGTGLGTRIASRHWFSDPVLAGETEESESTDPTDSDRWHLDRRLAQIFGRPTAALVVLAWRRAARAPLKLLYAAYPLLFVAGIGANVVRTGVVPSYLPVVVLVALSWAAGVVFTLNPLGDQGAVLPTTVLSEVTGRDFVRAHVLATLVVGVPLGVLATAAVAVPSPLDPLTVIALVGATPILMAVVAGLSVGIGVAFPRFEEAQVTRSMKTVIPSRIGFVVLTLYLALTTTAGVVVYDPALGDVLAAVVSVLLPFGLSLSGETMFAVAVVGLVPLVLAPAASYVYAIRRYDSYHLN